MITVLLKHVYWIFLIKVTERTELIFLLEQDFKNPCSVKYNNLDFLQALEGNVSRGKIFCSCKSVELKIYSRFRAAQKLNLSSKRKKHPPSLLHPQEPSIYPTNFSGILQVSPPPAPPCLLRAVSKVKENPGMGKVRTDYINIDIVVSEFLQCIKDMQKPP